MVLSGDTVIRLFADNRSHARIVPFGIYVFVKMVAQVGLEPTTRSASNFCSTLELLSQLNI
jgi:hypothetical protein